jgi:hypothetical protein
MESKTCTLTITAGQGKKSGSLYFLEGTMIDAETPDLEGEEAAYEIVSWEDAKIKMVNTVKKAEKKITQPLMNILMEAAKLKDENEEETETPPDITKEPAGQEPKGGKPLDDMPKNYTVEQLLESSPMSETLSEMKNSLAKIMGPRAEAVFVDSLESWMTSGEPSMSSIPLLLDILDSEIADPEKITHYRDMIESLFE